MVSSHLLTSRARDNDCSIVRKKELINVPINNNNNNNIFSTRPMVHSGIKLLLKKVNQSNTLGHLNSMLDICRIEEDKDEKKKKKEEKNKCPFENPHSSWMGPWVTRNELGDKDMNKNNNY